MSAGRLIGVGVGPGDPELMTLKAWKLIQAARVIAYPAPDSGQSFARRIAAAAIPPDAREIPMVVPMRPDRFAAEQVYEQASAEIAGELKRGIDVVVLCEGDPLFYGSFIYLLARLTGRFDVEIVPGVSSVMACAAVLRQPLAARNEVLQVLPATLPEEVLRDRLQNGGASAIIKLGRHFAKVRKVIDDLGLTDRAGYVGHATLPDQIARPLADAPAVSPYFSMILVQGDFAPWTS